MYSWFRLSALLLAFAINCVVSEAQPLQILSGTLPAGDVRVLVRDSLYRINGRYTVAGTLVVEPGTTVEFVANGQLIDSVGGRIIADGRANASYSATNYTNVTRPGGGLAYDYSDPAYFMSSSVISRTTMIEPTVAPSKNDITFNVILDTLTRRIENLPSLPADAQGKSYVRWPIAVNPASGATPPTNQLYLAATTPTIVGSNSYYDTKFVVSYEYALMWITSRLSNPTLDPAIRTRAWTRLNFASPSVGGPGRDRILFLGRAINSFSREWGHIVVLPGARAAFFRDCDFQNFRKDTTVSRLGMYSSTTAGDPTSSTSLNFAMNTMLNGSGGALSVLSSRTWLVGCTFSRNMARYHGGALQFNQAPIDNSGAQYPVALSGTGAAAQQYNALPANYRPAILGAAASPTVSSIIVNQYLFEQNANRVDSLLAPPRSNVDPANPTYVRAHDNLYYGGLKEMDDQNRQAVDDGRLAIYLGRVRQLTFTQNKTHLTNIAQVVTSQGVVVTDDETNPATTELNANWSYKNHSYGGAVYIGGRWAMDIGLGVNDFQGRDFVIFDANNARNFQNELSSGVTTGGSKGGALYVTGATSLTTTGRYRSNSTETKYLTTYNAASYNQGGAVYMSSNSGRIMLRGGQDVQVPMYMTSNSAARGGAIYSDENFSIDPSHPSPHIGGANGDNILVRNLGYNIKFQNNTAKYDGGAIFAKRNFLMYGAGGVVSNVILGYSQAHLIEMSGNTAGYSGGAVAIHLRSTVTEPERAYLRCVRSVFDNNRVGENLDSVGQLSVRGGGAIYSLNAELQTVQGCEFHANLAQAGNGGAIALVNPKSSFSTSSGGNFQRVFCTDVDSISYGSNPAFVTGFKSTNEAFTFAPGANQYPAHVRMMTRFLDNRCVENNARMGKGATQAGSVTITHPGSGATTGPDASIGGSTLQENGTGLGGGLYILDQITASRAGRLDSVFLNRVRFQNQSAYSGAAIYSDNYDLKLVMLRSLVANNTATSSVGADQNAITGPMITAGTPPVNYNSASSDLAGAIIYGEAIGPVPFASFSRAANSMFDNNARFLIRYPDAPNTKGIFAGTTGIGYGGVDSLNGNYWGHTEANVTTRVYRYDGSGNVSDSLPQETFFVAGNGTQQLSFVLNGTGKQQGPFESIFRYSYTAIPMLNGADDKTPAAVSIPEKLLQQGRIYDSFDKGTDIKTADYTKRRMSPIEDFAVGIPTTLSRFSDPNQPSFNKYVKRYTRNPFVAEVDTNMAKLQTEYKGDHPIGYPLFLEAKADYTSASELFSNNDVRSINETVFFVINTATGDYIRVNLSQVDPTSETFRSRVDIVPDSTLGGRIAGGYQVRRNAEGLANFGTDLASILAAIKRNPENEDAGTLQGRKYDAVGTNNDLGGNGFAYSNRPALPTSNIDGFGRNIVTYFAGERYNTIPAKVGDQLAIVSRSALWREVGSNNDAFAGALIFTVGATTPAPVWTGNKLSTANPTNANGSPVPPIFKNKIFVSEDRTYPRDASDISRAPGRDTIFAITARDTNKFYDPRSILDGTKYSQLSYGWSVDANSGLSHWLKADTIAANVGGDETAWWQAHGRVSLKGTPSNPYVVPEGEWVNVTARNFPPSAATIDSMKAAGVAADVIAKYIYLYPSYYANQSYDATNARWLQQDTVNYGWGADTTYRFRVFVTDSLPVFTAGTFSCEANNRLYANLTDSLRFKADFNTDDEAEDAAAERDGWQFKYGRTSYNWLSENRTSDTSFDQVVQVRPSWLAGKYLRKYTNSGQLDQFGSDFTTQGQLAVAIDSATAIAVLSPIQRYHNSLNTDTVFTIVANDGHGGISTLNRIIVVNVAPTILTESLPDAWEDVDYNKTLTGDTTYIRVSDPNFGQRQTYELIYAGDPRKTIARDGCFAEAGSWDISNAATPAWLKINPISGMLFGTPRVTDTKMPDTTVTVTVFVHDDGPNGGLTTVKTLTLKIHGVNHNPHVFQTPQVLCRSNGDNVNDTIKVTDVDLRRSETVNLRIISNHPGLKMTPESINGALSMDTVSVAVTGTLNVTPYKAVDTIKVEVTDIHGGVPDTLKYIIRVSESTVFTSNIVIANNKGAFETLSWGTGTKATTGDNSTKGGIGHLDSNYCEYELPPMTYVDVFDARWAVPQTNGMLRNFFPACASGDNGVEIYKGRYQAGGVVGNQDEYYPVTFKWKMSEVPKRTDTQKNPCGGTYYLMDGVGGSLFAVDMANGNFRTQSTSDYDVIVAGDEVTLIQKRSAVSSFVILWDEASPVGDDVDNLSISLDPIVPNPMNGSAKVSFNVPTASSVQIDVFDNLGNKVQTIANRQFQAGKAELMWDGRGSNGSELPSGSYTIKMSVGAFSAVQKAIIVR